MLGAIGIVKCKSIINALLKYKLQYAYNKCYYVFVANSKQAKLY